MTTNWLSSIGPATPNRTYLDWRRRRVLELLTAAAALALGLAAFGIYGVLSYAITQRRSEIAVRLACGATPSTSLASVISDAARVTSVGTVLGLLGSAAATRLLGALLFEVSPLDWRTLSAAALLLAAAALCAAWVPARRAAGLDPVEVFRSAVGRFKP